MRQCPNCKTNNPDDARFCNYCGMRLPESKEETLYSDLDELEEAPKTEFSDQEIEEESEKVIDEAKKLLNPDEKEEKEVFLQEEKKEERKEEPPEPCGATRTRELPVYRQSLSHSKVIYVKRGKPVFLLSVDR